MWQFGNRTSAIAAGQHHCNRALQLDTRAATGHPAVAWRPQLGNRSLASTSATAAWQAHLGNCRVLSGSLATAPWQPQPWQLSNRTLGNRSLATPPLQYTHWQLGNRTSGALWQFGNHTLGSGNTSNGSLATAHWQPQLGQRPMQQGILWQLGIRALGNHSLGQMGRGPMRHLRAAATKHVLLL